MATCRPNTWTMCSLFGALMFSIFCLQGAESICVTSSPTPTMFSETRSPGFALWNVTTSASETWRFQVVQPAPSASGSLQPYFRMDQNETHAILSLNQTLDLEEVKNIMQDSFTIELSIICNGPGVPDVVYTLFVTVTAENEFPPEFVSLPASGFNISESLVMNDPLFVLKNYVLDRDVAPNQPGFDFSLLPTDDPTVDGRSKLTLLDSLTGTVIVKELLDYESMDPAKSYYFLKVSVGDREGKTSTGTVRINIMDADDQPPEFWYPNCTPPCFTSYSAAIRDDFQGEITWLEPAAIAARDLDTLDSRVSYNFKQGKPEDYREYLKINSTNGALSVIKPVNGSSAAAFVIIVEAVEETPLRHSEHTTLWLKVIGRNSTDPTLPPIIVNRAESGERSFRIAAIVLGVLFGLVLILLILFVLCSVSSKGRTMPVLGKAISNLSSANSDGSKAVSPRSSDLTDDEDKGRKKKSVKLRKLSEDGARNFIRRLSRPVSGPPALRSFASIKDINPDVENLPATGEIEYDQNATADQQAEISTISTADLVPYEDRIGLVDDDSSVDQERVGVSNPVYKTETVDDGVDVSVIPIEQAHITI